MNEEDGSIGVLVAAAIVAMCFIGVMFAVVPIVWDVLK